MATLEAAIQLAVEMHSGQVDRAGLPYILHPLRVMFASPPDETSRVIAVLHDVVEDTPITFDDLRQRGFSEEIIGALDCLTRREGETYAEFIERAVSHPLARPIKIADVEDNMDIRRLDSLDEKDLERLQRYQQAWARLHETDSSA